ncbi:unnamed protein product [Cuscuta epithymum]|uniref:Uncharacterized protein n=1 Tax=Cuscuta epithymum TaxID=186058 RepID=A0AAV0FWF2_9ASTE|nr:unnamed protein product [Cuscuta epithymum]
MVSRVRLKPLFFSFLLLPCNEVLVIDYALGSIGVMLTSRNSQPLHPAEREQPHQSSAPDSFPFIFYTRCSTKSQCWHAALEILRDVMDAVDPLLPEGGKDEFTFDLVEQCSFQKPKDMHLTMTSRTSKHKGGLKA